MINIFPLVVLTTLHHRPYGMITAIALCWLGPLLMMMIGGKHLQEGFPVQPIAKQSRLADEQLSHSISPGEEEEEEEEEDDDGGDDGEACGTV